MDRDDDRDESIVEARITGTSTRALAKLHRCTSSEVEEVIDRKLDFVLDGSARLKAVKLDLARIETLMAPFFERATKDCDVAAGTLCCKLLERRALLLGLDQSPTARVDVYQIQASEQPSRHDRIMDAIMRVARGPNWRDLPPDDIDKGIRSGAALAPPTAPSADGTDGNGNGSAPLDSAQ